MCVSMEREHSCQDRFFFVNNKSEVSQKEKNKYRMLMHIHGILKSGTDEPSGRARNKDADVENGLEGTGGEGEAGMK